MTIIDEQFKAEQDLAILKQSIYTRRLPKGEKADPGSNEDPRGSMGINWGSMRIHGDPGSAFSPLRLPLSYNAIDDSIDNIEQTLNRTIIDENVRTTLLTRRCKTIAQFQYDMLVLTVATIEERIRACRQVISNDKDKLVSRNMSTSFESVLKKEIMTRRIPMNTNTTNWVQHN